MPPLDPARVHKAFVDGIAKGHKQFACWRLLTLPDEPVCPFCDFVVLIRIMTINCAPEVGRFVWLVNERIVEGSGLNLKIGGFLRRMIQADSCVEMQLFCRI